MEKTNLRTARFLAGITQMELANRAGIHQSRISAIENAYVNPRDDERVRIARGLQKKPDDIVWPVPRREVDDGLL